MEHERNSRGRKWSSFTIWEIVASSITATSIILLAIEIMFIFLLAQLIWIIIPAIIITLYSFIDALFIRKQARVVLLPLHLLTLVVAVGSLKFGGCSPERMALHFDKNEATFNKLAEYKALSAGESCFISIEQKWGKLSGFTINTSKASYQNSDWDEHANPSDMQIIVKSGLTEEKLKNICRKLDKVDCKSINVRQDYIVAEYKRVGAGLFSYYIHNRALTEEEIEEYDNGIATVFYRDNVVFRYDSGAFGSMSFPRKQEFLEKRKTKTVL